MIAPGEHPQPHYLEPTMQAFKKAVNIGADEIGDVQSKKLDRDIYVIFNRDRYLAGLEGNRKIGDDILAGHIYILGVTSKGFPRALTGAEVERYTFRFWEPGHFDDIDVVEANLNTLYQALEEIEEW